MHHWAALAHIGLLSACRLVELCKLGARCLLKGVQGRHTYGRCGGLAAWRGSSFSMSSAQTGDRQDPVWWAQGLVGCCWEQEPLGSCPVCIPCHPAGTLVVSHLATWLFVRLRYHAEDSTPHMCAAMLSSAYTLNAASSLKATFVLLTLLLLAPSPCRQCVHE